MRFFKSLSLSAALVAISAGSAMAGFTTGVQNGVASSGPVGTGAGIIGGETGNGTLPANSTFTHNYAGAEFTPGQLRVVGDLTEVHTSTWASEARFEVCNPTSCVILGAGLVATGNFTGTLAINSTVALPAGLTGSSIGNWTFEAFEGGGGSNDAGQDAVWNNLTLEIQNAIAPVPAFSGNFAGTPNNLTHSVLANGTTLNTDPQQPGLTDGAGQGAAVSTGTRYGNSSFEHLGNEVGYRINHVGGDLIVDMVAATQDLDLILLDSTGIPLTGTLARSEGGLVEQILVDPLPAGTYYAVVDGFGSANPGSNYTIVYTPEPGTIVLLGLGVVGLIRRRR